MGKALGYIEVLGFLIVKLHGKVLAEGGRRLAQVHHHVKDMALADIYQLGVVKRRQLEMHAPYHVAVGNGIVELPEIRVQAVLTKEILIKQLLETASLILEMHGLQDVQALERRIDNLHDRYLLICSTHSA